MKLQGSVLKNIKDFKTATRKRKTKDGALLSKESCATPPTMCP